MSIQVDDQLIYVCMPDTDIAARTAPVELTAFTEPEEYTVVTG